MDHFASPIEAAIAQDGGYWAPTFIQEDEKIINEKTKLLEEDKKNIKANKELRARSGKAGLLEFDYKKKLWTFTRGGKQVSAERAYGPCQVRDVETAPEMKCFFDLLPGEMICEISAYLPLEVIGLRVTNKYSNANVTEPMIKRTELMIKRKEAICLCRTKKYGVRLTQDWWDNDGYYDDYYDDYDDDYDDGRYDDGDKLNFPHHGLGIFSLTVK